MSDIWSTGGTWLKCALHAHTTRSDGELGPRDLAATTRGPATTCSRSRTTGASRTRTRSTGSSSSRASSSTASSPALATATSSATASRRPRTTCARWRRSTPTSHRRRSGSWRAAAFPTSRIRTGPASPRDLELPESVVGIEVYNAGCELEIGRGLSSVHWDELLETGRLCPAIASDDSHHPGYDSDLAWTWLDVGERSREACWRRSRPAGSRPRPARASTRSSSTATSVEVRCSPCRTVTLVSGRSLGASVHGRTTRLPAQARELECDSDGRIVHARLDVPAAGRHVRVEITDARGEEGMGEPVPRMSRERTLAAARRAPLRRARRRRRDHRCRDRRARRAGRARASHSSTRRLRRERRRARRRSSSTAGCATCASATCGSCARRTTSGASSRRSSRRTSSTGRRSCSPSTAAARSGPRSCRAGSSSTRARALAGQLARRPDARAASVPPLRLDGLRSCALYADATTNDARLCLANVRAAADAGACVAQRRRGRRRSARQAGRVVGSGGRGRRRGRSRSRRARSSTPRARGWTTSAGSRIRAAGRRCG